MQELICSCTDVIPTSETDDELIDDINDNTGSHAIHIRHNNNYHDHERNDPEIDLKQQPVQRQEVPNPAAVLKTVAALIALDSNPHHQNIKNLNQQQEFHSKLQQYQKLQKPQLPVEDQEHFHVKKPDWGKQRHCVLVEENEDVEEVLQKDVSLVTKIRQEEQKTITATCTKEQMMRDFEKSNYNKFERYDSNLNEDLKTKNNAVSYKFSFCRNDNQSISNDQNGEDDETHRATASLGNFYRHCKLKTFQNIKLNLITHHGNNGCLMADDPDFDATATLQTIVETENDVISGGTGTGPTSGLYQIVDEKYNNELSLKVFSSLNEVAAASPTSNKYKLLELTCAEKAANEKIATSANSVSKRIEFFEHANIPNGGIIKPKSNIYSIYRVNESALLPEEKLLVKNVVKEKEAGSSKTVGSSFLLRHDSHTLTIILSCVFIVTFLLLVFFPIPG